MLEQDSNGYPILAFKQRFSFQNYHMPRGWVGGQGGNRKGGFSGLNGHWSTLPDHSTVYTSQGFQMNISEWMDAMNNPRKKISNDTILHYCAINLNLNVESTTEEDLGAIFLILNSLLGRLFFGWAKPLTIAEIIS
jgi:hypothetical protein